jgi:hypothetical protein
MKMKMKEAEAEAKEEMRAPGRQETALRARSTTNNLFKIKK